MIRFLKSGDHGFEGEIERIVKRGERDLSTIEDSVRRILQGVKDNGDNSLLTVHKGI